MSLKIKWNDDRVRGATTAILLLGREHIGRGATEGLARACLTEYRADPEAYKRNKAAWPDARAPGPLTKPSHLARYRNLIAAIDRLSQKLAQGKPQFSSLLELDNWLAASLRDERWTAPPALGAGQGQSRFRAQ